MGVVSELRWGSLAYACHTWLVGGRRRGGSVGLGRRSGRCGRHGLRGAGAKPCAAERIWPAVRRAVLSHSRDWRSRDRPATILWSTGRIRYGDSSSSPDRRAMDTWPTIAVFWQKYRNSSV